MRYTPHLVRAWPLCNQWVNGKSSYGEWLESIEYGGKFTSHKDEKLSLDNDSPFFLIRLAARRNSEVLPGLKPNC
jgi:hypothetical protein